MLVGLTPLLSKHLYVKNRKNSSKTWERNRFLKVFQSLRIFWAWFGWTTLWICPTPFCNTTTPEPAFCKNFQWVQTRSVKVKQKNRWWFLCKTLKKNNSCKIWVLNSCLKMFQWLWLFWVGFGWTTLWICPTPFCNTTAPEPAFVRTPLGPNPVCQGEAKQKQQMMT